MIGFAGLQGRFTVPDVLIRVGNIWYLGSGNIYAVSSGRGSFRRGMVPSRKNTIDVDAYTELHNAVQLQNQAKVDSGAYMI